MSSRIQMFMNDLGFRSESMPPVMFNKMAYFLKGFDTLVVCARTLGEDAGLMSLLTRIDQVFTRNAEIIELRGRGGFQGAIPVDLIRDFGADLKSFEIEIDGWYTTLSNSPHSRSPTLIDVIEIIDSVLEDLRNFHCVEFSDIGDDSEGMEEKLQFLRNFIEFVEMLNAEHLQVELQGFVIQVASVAVSAAHVCARLHGLFDAWNVQGWMQVKHGWKQIQPQILALLQRIRPIGVEVSQAYETAMSISKSSEELRYSMDLDPSHYSLVIVIRDFVDFLLWCLWETLEMDSCVGDSMKDQVRPLWGGLKFLRENLYRFDEGEIRKGVCDAGMVIFLLHHGGSEISDLFGNVEAFLIGLKSLIGFLSPTAVLRDLNYILDSLMVSTYFDGSQTVRLRLDLVYLTSSLELLIKLKDQQEEALQIQALWSLAKQVADSLKILWDRVVAGNLPDSVSPLVNFISTRISIFRQDFSAIYPATSQRPALHDVTSQITHSRRPEMEEEKVTEVISQINFPAADKVVGFQEDEIRSILDRLAGGPKHLTLIPIVGMAGLGKTTFALQLYNHPSLIDCFQLRVSFSVSQVYSLRKLFLDFLNQIHPHMSSRYSQMKGYDLALNLLRTLKGKRYLVFLDDVWDRRIWKTIRICFPDDFTGSRILLTSRDRDVIRSIPSKERPYLLRLRSDVESLEILRTKLFPDDDFPVVLRDLGMRIAESCKGLPMTIVAVARLLTTLKPDDWKKVLESLSSNTLSRSEQFINSSELSYRYLPDHLKLCFLSFRLFSEKEEVSAKWLCWLWIAEGLVQETQGKKIEDVAMQYMNDLVNKSLIVATKTTSLGETKTCRVHESIHGFCIRKAEVENFSHVLKGYDDTLAVNELPGSRRLCIQSSRRDFKSLRLSRPDIHSLLFLPLKDSWPRVVDDVSFIVRVFKSLRVLHIRQIDLGEVFPVEMKLLVELRYLAVRGHFVDLPSSIGSLSNLETLIVDSHLEIALPVTIWDLHKLRHLCIKNGFLVHLDNPDNSSALFQLESCSIVIAESWDIFERLMKKFPNVSKLKLKCSFLDSISIPDCMHQLESLHVSTAGVTQHCHQFELNDAWRLRRLTLKGLELSESLISSVGKLPCLESLKLLNVSFFGGRWHMKEDDFQKLKYFKLSDSSILSWTADIYELSNLERLVLQGCTCLEEIPMELLELSYLRVIEVFNCSPSVELQVKQVEETLIRNKAVHADPQAPVLFQGIGHSVNPANKLVLKVLSASPAVYSANSKSKLSSPPAIYGSSVSFVSVVQDRNNARMLISGSLKVFSNQ